MAQGADEAAAKGARDALIEYVREDAASKGQPSPVQEDELSGVRVHAIGKLHLAVMGNGCWLRTSRCWRRIATWGRYGGTRQTCSTTA